MSGVLEGLRLYSEEMEEVFAILRSGDRFVREDQEFVFDTSSEKLELAA